MTDDRTQDPKSPGDETTRRADADRSGAPRDPAHDSTPAAENDGRRGTSPGWGRRELFKAMASVPVLGTLGYGVWRKNHAAAEKRRRIFE